MNIKNLSPTTREVAAGLGTFALSYYLARKIYKLSAKEVRQGKLAPMKEYSKMLIPTAGIVGLALLGRSPILAAAGIGAGSVLGAMHGAPELVKAFKERQRKAAGIQWGPLGLFIASVGGGFLTGRYIGKRMMENYMAKRGIVGAKRKRVSLLAWPVAVLTMPWSLIGISHGINEATTNHYFKYVNPPAGVR